MKIALLLAIIACFNLNALSNEEIFKLDPIKTFESKRVIIIDPTAERGKNEVKLIEDFGENASDFFNSGNYNRAILLYTKALEEDKLNILYLFKRGVSYYNQNQFESSIKDFTLCLQVDNKHYHSYYNRGLSFLSLNEYDKALEDFNNAYKIYSEDPKLNFQIAYIYHRQKDKDKAITYYNNVLKGDPDYYQALINRGVINTEREKYDAARADISLALDLTSWTDYYAVISLGHLNLAEKKYSDAIQSYEKAVSINDQSDIAFFNLGNAYYMNKEFNKAIDNYSTAINLNKDPIYYQNRSIAYEKSGNNNKAIDDLETAFKISNDPHLYVLISRIYFDSNDILKGCFYIDSALNKGFVFEKIMSDSYFKGLMNVDEFKKLIDKWKN